MFLLLASAQNFNYVTIQFLSVSLHGGETGISVPHSLAKASREWEITARCTSACQQQEGLGWCFFNQKGVIFPLKGEGLLPLIRYLAASCSLINYWGCISTQLVFLTILAGFQFIPECASYFFKVSSFPKAYIWKKRKEKEKQLKEQSIDFKQIK